MVGLRADKLYFTSLDPLTRLRIDEMLVDLAARPALKDPVSHTPVMMSIWVGAGISPFLCRDGCIDSMHHIVTQSDRCKSG